MDDFYVKLADILEVDEIKLTDTLESFSGWDSLGMLSVIAMIGSEFGVNLTARDLRGVDTAQGLYDLVAQKSRN